MRPVTEIIPRNVMSRVANARHYEFGVNARPAHLPQIVAFQTAGLLLVYRIFQCLTSAELGHARSLDLDRLAGARVAAGARRALADLERAETDQSHVRTFFEGC